MKQRAARFLCAAREARSTKPAAGPVPPPRAARAQGSPSSTDGHAFPRPLTARATWPSWACPEFRKWHSGVWVSSESVTHMDSKLGPTRSEAELRAEGRSARDRWAAQNQRPRPYQPPPATSSTMMTMIRSVVVSMLRQGLRYLRLHRRHGRSLADPLQGLVWAIAWPPCSTKPARREFRRGCRETEPQKIAWPGRKNSPLPSDNASTQHWRCVKSSRERVRFDQRNRTRCFGAR